MNDQLARGLPPIDDEYQGPSWWHFSRLADARRNPGHAPHRRARGGRPRGLAGHGDPERRPGTGTASRSGSAALELPVTIYPPFVLSLLAAVWLGPTWGLVPAYAANLAGALVGGLGPAHRAPLRPGRAPSRC